MSSQMNFFEHQDIARRNTRLLVILFTIAVIAVTTLTGLVVAIAFGGLSAQTQSKAAQGFVMHWDILLASSGVVISAIGLAVAFKWMILRPGGKIVAEKLGGRRLSPDSTDPLERKVLNVVEEMALAANMPVPPVYLLEHEQGINAFAAGYSPKDAVIGLTRGCVENLTRSQLQGVVAHEIAHILNGDMRMNIRIMALLNGILFISHAGYLLLRTGMFAGNRRDNGKNPLPLLGLALLVIGSIGVLFGNIIKAAVSRQREFLADASAVQFTREPEGIGGALQQIGALQSGSRVESKNASEASHLFFGQAISKAMSIFATHPPLEQRIKRVLPQWDGKFEANPPTQKGNEPSESAKQQAQGNSAQDNLNRTLGMLAMLPESLRQEARKPSHAQSFIYALLLSDDASKRRIQVEHLAAERVGSSVIEQMQNDYEQLGSVSTTERLPLIELTMPTLKGLSKEDKQTILKHARQLPEIGGAVSLYEWCLSQMVVRYLSADLKPNPHVGGVKQNAKDDLALTLSVLAQFGHSDAKETQHAFNQACASFGAELALTPANALNFSHLDEALTRIDKWSAKNKERLVNAWIACIEADNEVTDVEYKLIYTLANCISEPLPELNLSPAKS
ncbi:M48 family metallopeptidase [Aliidiomarina sp. B3213]|nr:M48 family metallopeptidase [Aliidiomarina sp. B3213]RTE85778.1 peptidase [Aliidiomarina sp. B3213]TCZ90219.1 peptidase [Lysobacter sp. N42]